MDGSGTGVLRGRKIEARFSSQADVLDDIEPVLYYQSRQLRGHRAFQLRLILLIQRADTDIDRKINAKSSLPQVREL